MWRTSPLKSQDNKLQGFDSVKKAQTACTLLGDGARLPSDMSALTKNIGGGNRQLDPEKTRLFAGGGLPTTYYWIDNGTARMVNGLVITDVPRDNLDVASALCVKNNKPPQ
jgi:hypothetical protein